MTSSTANDFRPQNTPRHLLPYVGQGAAMREPTLTEKLVFGVSVRLHPITEMPLEDGYGALPDDVQAWRQHCALIEERHGKAVADAMRKKLTDVAKLKAAKTDVAAATDQVKKDGIAVTP
jgi:hypothetical protein